MATEYTNIGRVHVRRALNAKTTGIDRQKAWREARAANQRSWEIWPTMREKGQFHAADGE